MTESVYWIENPGQFEWVAFKLKSAEFHIDTLATVGAQHGFSRLAGVEMALDAALSALSGAFDAAVAELTESIERHCSQGGAVLPWIPIPEHKCSFWGVCDTVILSNFNDHPVVGKQVLDLRRTIKAALKRRTTGRSGWLAELRDLRNRSTHHRTLTRLQTVNVGSPESEWLIIVGGDHPEDPVVYLRAVHGRLVELTTQMLRLTKYFSAFGVPTPLDRRAVTVSVPAARVSVAVPPPKVSND